MLKPRERQNSCVSNLASKIFRKYTEKYKNPLKNCIEWNG